MTTVARRNRVWTNALRTEFVNEVNTLRQQMSVMSAFREVGQKWGLAPSSACSTFYNFRSGNTRTVFPKNRLKGASVAPKTSLKNNDVQNAIATLKKLGVKVTLTF